MSISTRRSRQKKVIGKNKAEREKGRTEGGKECWSLLGEQYEEVGERWPRDGAFYRFTTCLTKDLDFQESPFGFNTRLEWTRLSRLIPDKLESWSSLHLMIRKQEEREENERETVPHITPHCHRQHRVLWWIYLHLFVRCMHRFRLSIEPRQAGVLDIDYLQAQLSIFCIVTLQPKDTGEAIHFFFDKINRSSYYS